MHGREGENGGIMGGDCYIAAMKIDYLTQQSEWMAEREREVRLRETGPYYHVYTKHVEDQVLICPGETLDVAIVYMALAARDTGVTILVYAVMSNHFHWILRGSRETCREFFEQFRHLMDIYLARHSKIGIVKNIQAGYTEITTPKQFRDETAYVLRNPFVVRTDIHPFFNPWTSARLYFSPCPVNPAGIPAGKLSFRTKRGFTKSNTLLLSDEWQIVGSQIDPSSFVDYKTVESFFSHARQFTYALFKNTERQVEIAMNYGEAPVIPDEEMLPIVLRLCRERFGLNRTGKLSDRQKKELAVTLRQDYGSSRSQLARMTGLQPAIIEAMFPDLQ